jgi:hypothetical protein
MKVVVEMSRLFLRGHCAVSMWIGGIEMNLSSEGYRDQPGGAPKS